MREIKAICKINAQGQAVEIYTVGYPPAYSIDKIEQTEIGFDVWRDGRRIATVAGPAVDMVCWD